MKKGRLLFGFIAAVFFLFSGAMTAFSEETDTFYRLDSGHSHDRDDKAGNLRLLTEGKYRLKPVSDKYLDPSFTPSEKGMGDLHISGSAQYSRLQFPKLAQTLRYCAGGDPVYVIDLRQESHALVNGVPVSVYGNNNTANRGKDLAGVTEDERKHFGSLAGGSLTVYRSAGNGEKKKDPVHMEVQSVMSEKELVESEGFSYLRLPATDHEWPEDSLVDTFIDFVKTLDMDYVWLHFHCFAGRGRTGVFMYICDMMKNPDVPLEDIAARQAMTGASYLLQDESPDPKKSERARKLRLMYEYIRENRESGYEKSWTAWLSEREGAEAALSSLSFECKFLLDPDTVLDGEHLLKEEWKQALGLDGDPRPMEVIYAETEDRAFGGAGWISRIRWKSGKKKLERAYKKRYPVAGGDLAAALETARKDGFDLSDGRFSAEADWGFEEMALNLSYEKSGTFRDYEDLSRFTKEDAAQFLLEAMPEEVLLQTEGVSAEDLPEKLRLAGPVRFDRLKGELLGREVTLEIWPVRQKDREETAYIAELSFKADGLPDAEEGRKELREWLEEKGILLHEDSLKTGVILDAWL